MQKLVLWAASATAMLSAAWLAGTNAAAAAVHTDNAGHIAASAVYGLIAILLLAIMVSAAGERGR